MTEISAACYLKVRLMGTVSGCHFADPACQAVPVPNSVTLGEVLSGWFQTSTLLFSGGVKWNW